MVRQAAAPFLRLPVVLILAGVLLLAGCHHARHLTRTQKTFREGDMQKTLENVETLISKRSTGSMAVITWLEAATVYQAQGDFKKSNDALERAIVLLEHYERQPPIRALNEAKAVLTHQGLLTYDGRAYDRIFAYAYRGLNNLFLGDFEAARQDLMAAQRAQIDAARFNAERIEKMQAGIDEARGNLPKETQGYDIDQALNDEGLQAAILRILEETDKHEAAASYENPYVEWLYGVYHYSFAERADDL